ncbi:hypothetical protein U5801_00860 [Lamprobacter modestohalophilus]|uniref:hypothetical protein n=1 Tax=Lamprobacter modestohalophilus TaxID=1064514 RepID=UPI002ADEAE6A|nr:hypothetical protein [Lamprobacter modestohalophilus]MEA1048373.1 hypothetical protein [Lamprobacter modestohalophilus]
MAPLTKLLLIVVFVTSTIVEAQTDQDRQIMQDTLGYAMQNNFEAALKEAEKIKEPDTQDMLLVNILNFAVTDDNCSVMKEVVDRLNDPAMKGIFSMNIKNLCP